MLQFRNEQEHIDFLKPVCCKYRRFICKYLHITKPQLLALTSYFLNIPEESCHINSIATLQQMDNIIQLYKNICKCLIGKKNLPKNKSVIQILEDVR